MLNSFNSARKYSMLASPYSTLTSGRAVNLDRAGSREPVTLSVGRARKGAAYDAAAQSLWTGADLHLVSLQPRTQQGNIDSAECSRAV